MHLIDLVHEAVHRPRVGRASARNPIGQFNIEQRGALVCPAAGKLHRRRRTLSRIGGIEVRIAELRQQIETADGAYAGGRDGRIRIGEKRQAGANPARMRSVVEPLDFGLIRGDEIVVEAGIIVFDDECFLGRVRGGGGKVLRDKRDRDVEPRVDVGTVRIRTRGITGVQAAAQLVEATVTSQCQQPGTAAPKFGRPHCVAHAGEARIVAEAEIIGLRPFADLFQIALRVMDHRHRPEIRYCLGAPGGEHRVGGRRGVESHQRPVGVDAAAEKHGPRGERHIRRHVQASASSGVEEPIGHERARRLLRIHAVAGRIQVGRVRGDGIVEQRPRADKAVATLREE